MTFKELGLNESLIEAISYMNFETATEIQEKAIPEIINSKDIIGCAQTGTGKTAAFILPIMHRLMADGPGKGVRCMVLVPTRELAIQIDQQIQGLGYFTNISSFTVYGGGDGISWEQERRALSDGSDILIATPGRLISHLNNDYAKLDGLKYLILDEADRMLDIGFHDDILKIISYLPEKRQNLMFSATMAPKIRKLAREILQEPTEINLSVSKPAEGVTQRVILCLDEHKNTIVRHTLKAHDDFKSIIIFCSTKRKVESLTRSLISRGFNAKGVSSDYDQNEREAVLLDFKSRKLRIVVATDVLSRGIDIKDIDLVINYDVPSDGEDYVHRVGRTARAKTKGMAISLVNKDDMFKFSRIEQMIEREIEKEKTPEEIGESPDWEVDTKKKKRRNPRFNKNRKNFKGKPKGAKPHHHKKPGNSKPKGDQSKGQKPT